MINVLSKLLGGPSPVTGLLEHTEQVNACLDMLHPLLTAAVESRDQEVHDLAEKIFQLEQDADSRKVDLRASIPRSVFMPIPRGDMLTYVRMQDGLANKVEDLAMLLRIQPFWAPEEIGKYSSRQLLLELGQHGIDTAKMATTLTFKMCDLIKAGYKLAMSEEMNEIIIEIGRLEHITDRHQFRLIRGILQETNSTIPFERKYVSLEVIRTLSDLANRAQRMSDYFRTIMAD